MNKVKDFFNSHKYVVLWTISYIAVVWAILMFMFGFNIFSGAQWHMLTHAQLHGFAGFVFGLLMLAALPMYVATTCLIIRTNQPIITINITFIPKIFNAIIARIGPTPIEAPVPQDPTPTIIPDTTTTATTPDTDTNNFPPTMPRELRSAFIRARSHVEKFVAMPAGIAPTDAFTPDNTPAPETNVPGELPLPADFDFNDTFDNDMTMVNAPTFTDIDFGDNEYEENDDTEEITDSKSDDKTSAINAPDFNTDANISETPAISDTIKYLNAHGHPAQQQNNMITTANMVIAIHDDPDFWIADPEHWFAAGKQKTSPIIDLIKTSATAGRRPILYLAQTNIMDLENRTSEWTNMGVTVITDLSELPL